MAVMAEPRPKPPTLLFRLPILVLAGTLIALWVMRGVLTQPGPRHVPYSELLADVEAGKVKEARVESDHVVAVLKDEGGKKGESIVAERIPSMDERALLDAMENEHIVISGQEPRPSWWAPLAWTVLPLLALPLVFWAMGGALGAASRKGPMTFGRSKAKLYDKLAEQGITFEDVAGVDEAKAELNEVVRFLKEPEKYRAIGAHIPKGVLLVGAPGTGKTLLARAVAGESGAPFFSLSGSEFVEMFVGVGASRVRDLFEQAKTRAPCIIFIDELDAIGKARAGAAGFAANEEREQTLNQLLVEMDGFAPGSGLVIMAATNRPEILDKALLRAGRFDRQVLVDRPDVRGREAILRVHGRHVQLGPDVDLTVVARRTPGMVGADLANVVNEAALASVRRGASAVGMGDFEEAIDRLQLGLKKEGRLMSEDEKRRVAFHEAGHALVALSVRHADPVHRVTIIPRSIGALGATLQLPTEERYLLTQGGAGRPAVRAARGTLRGGDRVRRHLHGSPGRSGTRDDDREADGLPLRNERGPGRAHLGSRRRDAIPAGRRGLRARLQRGDGPGHRRGSAAHGRGEPCPGHVDPARPPRGARGHRPQAAGARDAGARGARVAGGTIFGAPSHRRSRRLTDRAARRRIQRDEPRAAARRLARRRREELAPGRQTFVSSAIAMPDCVLEAVRGGQTFEGALATRPRSRRCYRGWRRTGPASGRPCAGWPRAARDAGGPREGHERPGSSRVRRPCDRDHRALLHTRRDAAHKPARRRMRAEVPTHPQTTTRRAPSDN